MRLVETENLPETTISTPMGEEAALRGVDRPSQAQESRSVGETATRVSTAPVEQPQTAWPSAQAQPAANEVTMPDFRGDDLVSFVCAVAGSECSLTPMELEVARMRLLGWQRQAIANHMGRSTHTIDSHLKAVRRKLGSGSATALFKAAVETLNRRAQVTTHELD